MSKLKLIESALTTINAAKFQSLCDNYLAIRNPNYSAFSRIGSQSGKEKTTKGTPDSLLLLPNGKYIFVEYSTNISAGTKKLKDDILKCIDEEKTGIPKEQIAEIIICMNFNLGTTQIEGLRKILKDTRIRLTIITLDSLAVELNLHHRNLASEYLDLSLDTGQIVSLDQFIEEYNRKASAIATPLNNTFIERKEEQKSITQAISTSDFVIVTGPPGVGKTKLCIETIRAFLSESPSFEPYCVSYKNTTLLNDLNLYLDKTKDYILFVDDANRIDAFNQIMGFYLGSRTGQLKIVMTVRDYAYDELNSLALDFNPRRVDIERLPDEIIEKIIEAAPFNILNPHFKDPIKNIANGNPRLAIMAALLAKKEQNLNALRDVSDLFEKYYATFILDRNELSDDLYIKCLGLISFFFTIPYKDREITIPILSKFGIAYHDFISAIDELDKLELVEIQFEHVKIPEQNIGIYFFFKAFVQKELLSFDTLLNNYFNSNQGRFKDCVIPANNTFGYERVMKKLQPSLKNYWRTINDNWDAGYRFLTTFWFYMREETLMFTLNHVNQIQKPDSPEYSVHYERNEFSYKHEEVISLLGDFLRFSSTQSEAIEILFEYVRRRPEHLPELIHKIRDILTFEPDDYHEGFKRQYDLFDFLIKGLKIGDDLLVSAFYELSKTFLGCRFEHTKGGRNNSIVIYYYPIPNDSVIYEFRALIWETIFSDFQCHKELAFDAIQHYSNVHPDVDPVIMEHDVPYILKIINQHLSPEEIEHCKYVNNQIWWCRRNKVDHKSFGDLKNRFTNPLYELYKVLNLDRLRDKEIHDFKDYREYEKLKEKQISDTIKLTTVAEVKKFYSDFSILSHSIKSDIGSLNSLSIVLDVTIQSNKELGYELLQLIVDNQNAMEINPFKLFNKLLQNESDAKKVWEIISNKDFNLSTIWQLNYFTSLHDNLISKKTCADIIKTIQRASTPIYIHFSQFERYLKFDSKLFQKIITIIYKKNKLEGTSISVWEELFTQNFSNLGDDLGLIKRFYLQQRKIQKHFDYNLKALKKILSVDTSFLIDYVEGLYIPEKYGFDSDSGGLGFVWDLPNVEPLILKIFDLVRAKSIWLGINRHYCNTFFDSLDATQQEKAHKFLINFVKSNYSYPNKINEVVDIARHQQSIQLKTILKHYLELNQDVNDFSKIQWIGSGGIYHGDVIIADIRAAAWNNILSILEELNFGIKVIEIKTYIKDTINDQLKSADLERRQRFLSRY